MKARVTARIAIKTRTAMSTVLNESCGNLCRPENSSAAIDGLLAYTRKIQYESQPTKAVSMATSLTRSFLSLFHTPYCVITLTAWNVVP